MVAATACGVRELFEGLVDPRVIEAYDRLLVIGGCAKANADAIVGPGVIQALTSQGMAHILPHTPADPAWLRPASPDLALQGVLAGHQNRLAQDSERLLAGHRRLADAQAQYATATNGTLPEHLVSVISDRTEPSVPTDQYGYQEVGGNGTYNPNLAADGTDLTNAPITAGNASNTKDCCNANEQGCTDIPDGGVNKKSDSWTIVGQWDNNWDDGASFSYAKGASSNIGSEVGVNGQDYDFAGYDKYSTSSGFSQGLGTNDFYNSHQVAIYMEYHRKKWVAVQNNRQGAPDGTTCYSYQQWDRFGVVRSPAGHFILIWHKIWKDPSQTGTRWRTDNCQAFQNMENDGHDSYRFNQGYPYEFSITRDAGLTYGFAANLGGVAVQAETNHSTATENDVYYNQPSGIPQESRTDPLTFAANSTQHYFWGSNRAVDPNGGPQPKAVYNC